MNHRISPLRRVAIAAAATALPLLAAAQADGIAVTGLIDLSIGSTKSPGGSATKGVDSGKMSTSWWGIRGNEDLGSGLGAVYAIEAFMRSDTGAAGRFNGDSFWARNAYVGLTSKDWGRVQLGRNTTPLFVSTLIFNAFGDSFGFSPSIRHYFISGTVSGDTGWNDSLAWSSPNWGGLSATLIGALPEGNGGRNWGGNALYFSGPLGASFAYQSVRKSATEDDTNTWQLSGSYKIAEAYKAFAQYGKVNNKTTGNAFDIWGLGLSAQITPQGAVLAQYGQIKPDTGAKRTTFTVGYDYFLSKRTDVYAAAMNDKLSGVGSATSYSAGVRHRF